jgi:hypothetical protein
MTFYQIILLWSVRGIFQLLRHKIFSKKQLKNIPGYGIYFTGYFHSALNQEREHRNPLLLYQMRPKILQPQRQRSRPENNNRTIVCQLWTNCVTSILYTTQLLDYLSSQKERLLKLFLLNFADLNNIMSVYQQLVPHTYIIQFSSTHGTNKKDFRTRRYTRHCAQSSSYQHVT